MINIDNLTTDKLFDDLLPSFINIDGELYYFSLIKGRDGVIIIYETRGNKSLGSTYRIGDNLRDVCEKTIKWLIEFDYVKYMPIGYKEKYQNTNTN